MDKFITQEEYVKAQIRLEEIIDLVNDDTPEDNPILQELIKVSDIIRDITLDIAKALHQKLNIDGDIILQ